MVNIRRMNLLIKKTVQPLHDGGRYHIETSQSMDWSKANQWTGFYMITTSVMKGLSIHHSKDSIYFPNAFLGLC